mmetsp:Transcript_24747/g.66759  ORF Transcript_24747/g.66759 Transcript_24747/m.66759 type:complete len:239 (+) Transcript_24747:160-876(+)
MCAAQVYGADESPASAFVCLFRRTYGPGGAASEKSKESAPCHYYLPGLADMRRHTCLAPWNWRQSGGGWSSAQLAAEVKMKPLDLKAVTPACTSVAGAISWVAGGVRRCRSLAAPEAPCFRQTQPARCAARKPHPTWPHMSLGAIARSPSASPSNVSHIRPASASDPPPLPGRPSSRFPACEASPPAGAFPRGTPAVSSPCCSSWPRVQAAAAPRRRARVVRCPRRPRSWPSAHLRAS